LVEAPHHTIFAQLNLSCIGLDHELMSYSVVLELSVPRSSAFLSAVRKVVTPAPSMAKAEGDRRNWRLSPEQVANVLQRESLR
jgi:hypothetical protein